MAGVAYAQVTDLLSFEDALALILARTLRLPVERVPLAEASAGELAPIPTDAFSIDFTKIEYSYTLQKADGTADAPTRWSWDVKANKES